MKLAIAPGKYVIATSGGVDSMVLLHLLSLVPNIELIVAHYDHGIRLDSGVDREFVRQMAECYALPFESHEGRLGAWASEATARTARYQFLRRVQGQYQATAVITAHHQDDVLETAILNMSRGTGRRGLTALDTSTDLARPLLAVPKAELLAYARKLDLQWREDSTNADQHYLRNYIRHSVLPRFSTAERQQLLELINHLRAVNSELDRELSAALVELMHESQLDRRALAALPVSLVKELLTVWWRANGLYSYESKTLTRAVKDIATGQTGAIIPLKKGYFMQLNRSFLALSHNER